MIIGLLHRLSPSEVPLLEDWQSLGLILLGVAVGCLAYGYVLVGIGIAGYRLFDYLKFFISEAELPPRLSDLDTVPSDDNLKNGSS